MALLPGRIDADQLIAARKAAGLSQAELAGRMGITQPQLSRIESGQSAGSIRSLTAIAGALDCLPGNLITTDIPTTRCVVCNSPVEVAA